MFLGGVSICPWCVIGGDVGDGGGSSKNPPILEFHPRKNPKTILRKTQNSQSQFQIFSNGFQREKKFGIVKNPNPISLPKTGISYPKKLSKLNHLVKNDHLS